MATAFRGPPSAAAISLALACLAAAPPARAASPEVDAAVKRYLEENFHYGAADKVVVADVDGDGKPEIVLVWQQGGGTATQPVSQVVSVLARGPKGYAERAAEYFQEAGSIELVSVKGGVITVEVEGKVHSLRLEGKALVEPGRASAPGPAAGAPTPEAQRAPAGGAELEGCAPAGSVRSGQGRQPAQLLLTNRAAEPIRLLWADPAGGRRAYQVVWPGRRAEQPTFVTHRWLAVGSSGKCYGNFEVTGPRMSVEFR